MTERLNVLEQALHYARAGYPVFPVNERKHPFTTHGFHDATTDEALIKSWWDKWPSAGVALANTQGGDLLYGITEERDTNGKPTAIDCRRRTPLTAVCAASLLTAARDHCRGKSNFQSFA